MEVEGGAGQNLECLLNYVASNTSLKNDLNVCHKCYPHQASHTLTEFLQIKSIQSNSVNAYTIIIDKFFIKSQKINNNNGSFNDKFSKF